MVIKVLDTGIFWMCYILFIVAILLIPVARHFYYINKYKISFSEHSRKIIDSFCNNECIYVAKYQDIRGILFVGSMPLCIFMTWAAIDIGNNYSKSYLLFWIISTILVHIGSIHAHIEYLYAAFFMTKTSMLLRGCGDGNVFKTVPLQDVVSYMAYNTHFGTNQELRIITKDGKLFNLSHLDNRDELLDALRTFTNGIEETC